MTNSLQWDESCVTGFLALDRQHGELVEGLKQLVTRVEAGAPSVELAGLIDSIEVLFLAHVVDEEWVMSWIDYPALAEHLEEHRAFIDHLEAIRRSAEASSLDRTVLSTVSGRVVAILRDHVADADRRVGEYAFRHALSG